MTISPLMVELLKLTMDLQLQQTDLLDIARKGRRGGFFPGHECV